MTWWMWLLIGFGAGVAACLVVAYALLGAVLDGWDRAWGYR